jgi:predicted CoA-substrate-specific enzyme activase
VLRAFKEILRLGAADALRPPSPHLCGALGAALLSRNSGARLDADVIAGVAAEQAAIDGAPRIASRGWRLDQASDSGTKRLEYSECFSAVSAGEQVFIGLDIGSVSTKAVALSAGGDLLAAVYLLTAGKPLAAAKRALDALAGPIRDAKIAAMGVTGSGRKLVGHAAGADLVIDEITAQAKGAGHGCADADTIIEIGGQDAKFIRTGADGGVVDFEMNKVCSAGTGSFIQEQAARLGVDLKDEYARLALGSTTPLPFTSRCTVFMESDLVHHMQQGVSLPDLLLGVSRAVVENYLDRVVQGRRIGSRVVIQGGVAENASVVAAFRKRLKDAQVAVHPHPGVSGAIGVALLTLETYRRETAGGPFATSFKGPDFCTEYQASDFTCKGCENRCEVSVFQFAQGRFHFGDLCGKYSEALSGFDPGTDLTQALTAPADGWINLGAPVATIGMPQALLHREFFPFWEIFFSELGIRLQVSGPSSGEKLAKGLTRLPAETCLPVKLLFGHVAALESEGIRAVFIPSASRLLDGVSCPYVQHAAAMVQAGFGGLRVLTLPLLPGLPEKERERLVLKGAELFGVAREKVLSAYEKTAAAVSPRRQDFPPGARPAGSRPLAVLLGKPYNTEDRFVNLSLAAKLAKAGFDVAAAEQLVIPEDLPLPGHYESITWASGRRMLKIANWICGCEDLYPVVIGNFGCGPDSFTFPLLGELFADRPSLFLEFDEHRADAGLDTRVEAFAHRVARWRLGGRRQAAGAGTIRAGSETPHTITRALPPDGDTEYIIPYFSDHARAYAGAFGAKGLRARVLPLPDHRSYEAGVEFSGGKQCHPFQLIAGDLVNLARAGALSRGARYIVPRIESTCMITQYIPTIQRYMDRLGRSDVRVISSDSLELLHTFGPLFMYNLGKAILGIEYLNRLRYERRPYEITRGAVDAAYAAGLETIRRGQLEERINQGVLEAAHSLASVPTRTRGTKPVIAMTGDSYTRINQAANGGLFELLE